MVVMRTVVLGPRPPELEGLIQRRRELGIDTYDEVWEGSYHVAPAASAAHAYLDNTLAVLLHPYAKAAGLIGTGPFNLGRSEDYRVPDRGYHRTEPRGTWVPSAAMIVEIVSPDDEKFDKFSFYAAHGVEEILVADPRKCSLALWRRTPEQRYERAAKSAVMDFTVEEVSAAVTWPSLDD